MGMIAKYPVLEPPISPFETRSSSWTIGEAEQYYSWLVTNQTIRIDCFLRFFKTKVPADYRKWEDFLLNLGFEYSDRLRSSQFSQRVNRGSSLTSCGLALAFDASLLVAHLLMRSPGSKVHWELLLDPGAFSNNHTVLRGFTDNLYLDPVGGVYEARGLLAGKKSADLLEQVYSHWKDRIE